MTLEDFLSDFVKSPEGRIVMCNAVDGAEIGLHDSELVLAAFNKAFASMPSGPIPDRNKEFTRQLEDLAGPANFYGGKGLAGAICAVTSQSLVAVLPIGVLNKASAPDQDRFARALGTPACQFGNPAWVEKLKALPAKDRSFSFDPGFKFGSSFIWFTTSDLIREIVKKKAATASKADTARDALGLVHRQPSTLPDPPLVLVALRLPKQLAKTTAHFRPTFIDAGSHRRFSAAHRPKSRPDMQEWGSTIDLAVLDTDGVLANGYPERVIRPLDFGGRLASTKIKFDVLGEVTRRTAMDDALFSQLLADARDDAELKARVLGA